MPDIEKRVNDEPTPTYEEFAVKLKLATTDDNEVILSFPSTSSKATEENIQALADSITDPEGGVNFLADSKGNAFVALIEGYTILTQKWIIDPGGE